MKHPKLDNRPQIVKTIDNLISEIRQLESERPRFVYPFVTEITKEIMVEASHLLPNHNAKCRFLHGHSYKVAVTLRSRLWEGKGDTTEGMVVDFKEVKELLKTHVDEVFDHAYLNAELYERVTDENFNNQYLYLRTTAEQLAWWVFVRLWEEVESGSYTIQDMDFYKHNRLEIVQVDVWETTTSKATAKREYFNENLLLNNLKGHAEMLRPKATPVTRDDSLDAVSYNLNQGGLITESGIVVGYNFKETEQSSKTEVCKDCEEPTEVKPKKKKKRNFTAELPESIAVPTDEAEAGEDND
jgi:6-pyruvoyltetrahydropterin/6-carboxytetrahydropterin synthase